jgi:hypothetical protein
VGLVVARGVEGEDAEDFAVGGEDSDLEAGDEDEDSGVFVGTERLCVRSNEQRLRAVLRGRRSAPRHPGPL